jgi:organic radical activating enzyme
MNGNRAKKYRDNARVVITDECNKDCDFCCMKDENIHDSFKVVAPMYVANAQYDTVMITGGEPMLCLDKVIMFSSLIKYRNENTKIYVYTNGELLSRHDASTMKLAGVTGLTVGPKKMMGIDDRDSLAFIHSCLMPIRILIQDILIGQRFIDWAGDQQIPYRTWTLGETCHERDDEDRYRLSWERTSNEDTRHTIKPV